MIATVRGLMVPKVPVYGTVPHDTEQIRTLCQLCVCVTPGVVVRLYDKMDHAITME